jgi:hypothetical protein
VKLGIAGERPPFCKVMRTRRGIPNPALNRWNAEEIALLGTLPDREVARRTGRTLGAVFQQRIKLGIANRFDGRKRKRP